MQSTSRFILCQDVAFPVAVPISKMDTDSWAWNTEQVLAVLAPSRRRMYVLKDLGMLTVVIDPLERRHQWLTLNPGEV